MGVLLPKRVTVCWLAVLAAALVAATAWVLSAAAQTRPASAAASGGTIGNVRIEGIQRIEPETVRSYLLLQAGDPWDPERVDRSLKALFATGLFADVKLTREGNTLVVRVVENPIINRIAFEGNSKLADKDLNSEIQLRPRVVYTRTRVQNDVRRILELYRRRGRFAATVEPKIIQLSENRVDLVFEIFSLCRLRFPKFRRQPFAHFFAHEHRVRADVNDAALLEQTLHERFDVRINQRLAAADRDHWRIAFFGRAQTIFETHYVLERSRVFADPPATCAGEIASVQRFELQHGGELFRAAQLVPDNVGSDFRR